MIESTVSKVASGQDVIPDEYLVYAIFDANQRCAYVGMTRSAANRMRQHTAMTTNVATIQNQDVSDMTVMFFTKEDVDAIYTHETEEPVPSFEGVSLRKWAEDGEWFMCAQLHPYLNVRKGWPGQLMNGKSFLVSHGLKSRKSMMAHVQYILKEWNPPFDHSVIVDAFMSGCKISEIATRAGINISGGIE